MGKMELKDVIKFQYHLRHNTIIRAPSTRVDQDWQGDSRLHPQAGRDILFLSLSRLEPGIPIRPISPDPPR